MPRTHARTLPALVGLALAAVLLSTGCGSTRVASKPPDYAKLLAGSPPPLAALHEQAGSLIGGGVPSFDARLRQLRGYPVVVNKWASWCGPCRVEFPFFQRQAARWGKRVALIGVDSQDSSGAAKQFLDEVPVPYPSYMDPSSKIAAELKAQTGFPSTAFYDRRGQLLYTHIGQYASEQQLAADIKHYAG